MRRLPTHLAAAGYSPARYVPLSPAPELDQGQRLTDIQAIQRLFANGENGGYWPADPAYLYEDSAGTLPASRDGVIGLRVNAVSGKPNAVQATTANKPYLRRTPVSGKNWLDSNTATGALTATFASALGSACTIATVGAEGVSIAENQTVSTTYNLTPPYGYNGDVLIINRALTAVEKALVTRVLGRNVPMLGSELVTNGGFDIDLSGWTITAGVGPFEWDAGTARVWRMNGEATTIILNNCAPAQIGGHYMIKASYITRTSGLQMRPRFLFGGLSSGFIASTPPLNVSIIGVATTATEFTVSVGNFVDGFCSVDNISLKAIL